MEYTVHIPVDTYYEVTVEADSEEEAIEMALNNDLEDSEIIPQLLDNMQDGSDREPYVVD